MLVALIGYLGTMVMALAALVAAWFVVIGPPPQREARQPPPAIGAVARTAARDQEPQMVQPGPWGPAVVHRPDDESTATDDARAAAEQAAAAEKARQLKLARYRKRKEQEARQREEQQGWQYAQPSSQSYSTALGYDQEGARDRSPPPPPPVLYQFGPRRY